MTAPTERPPVGPDPLGQRAHSPSRDWTPTRDTLRCRATTSGSTLHLVLEGTVDFDNKNAFLDTVAVHLRQARADVTDLRVDTAGLTHCDSSALSALITVHRWATAAGIRLHLDRQPRFLRQMLTLTGLATYLGAPDGQHPAADTC